MHSLAHLTEQIVLQACAFKSPGSLYLWLQSKAAVTHQAELYHSLRGGTSC